MKNTIRVFAFCALLATTRAADFARKTAFDSVEAFVAEAGRFEPATAHSDLSSLFTIPEMGEGDNHGMPVSASAMASCKAIWSGDGAALVLAVANPPTDATRSCIGVLFLIVLRDGHWQIADLLRFTAIGKYAVVSCELTADAGTGYHLGEQGMPPVVTVMEGDGGRGYSFTASASYTIDGAKLKRFDLK